MAPLVSRNQFSLTKSSYNQSCLSLRLCCHCLLVCLANVSRHVGDAMAFVNGAFVNGVVTD